MSGAGAILCACCGGQPTCEGCNWRVSPYGVRQCPGGNYFPVYRSTCVDFDDTGTYTFTATVDNGPNSGASFSISFQLDGTFDGATWRQCGTTCQLTGAGSSAGHDLTFGDYDYPTPGIPIVRITAAAFSGPLLLYRTDADPEDEYPNAYSYTTEIVEWDSNMVVGLHHDDIGFGHAFGVDHIRGSISATYYAIGTSLAGNEIVREFGVNFVFWIFRNHAPVSGPYPTGTSETPSHSYYVCPTVLISVDNHPVDVTNSINNTGGFSSTATIPPDNPEYTFNVRGISYANFSGLVADDFDFGVGLAGADARIDHTPIDPGIDECPKCITVTFPGDGLDGRTSYRMCRCGRDPKYRSLDTSTGGSAIVPTISKTISDEVWIITGTGSGGRWVGEGTCCPPSTLTWQEYAGLGGGYFDDGAEVTIAPLEVPGGWTCDECPGFTCTCIQLDTDVTFDEIACEGTLKIAVNDDNPANNDPATIDVDVYKNDVLAWSGTINTTINTWQSTGVSFSEGDKLRVVSSDEYETETGTTVNAGGYVDGPFEPPDFGDLPCPSGLPWSLLGKIN